MHFKHYDSFAAFVVSMGGQGTDELVKLHGVRGGLQRAMLPRPMGLPGQMTRFNGANSVFVFGPHGSPDLHPSQFIGGFPS